jgi:hypothetical protein
MNVSVPGPTTVPVMLGTCNLNGWVPLV